jgi:hypothetical protein
VWMDHGRYSPAVVCPEPMTGFYDHLGRAYHDGKILIVTPGRPVQWSIRVTLGGSPVPPCSATDLMALSN